MEVSAISSENSMGLLTAPLQLGSRYAGNLMSDTSLLWLVEILVFLLTHICDCYSSKEKPSIL